MENKFDSEEYRGCTINMYYDDSPDDPRTWSPASTFVCEHPRYKLGDKQNIEDAVSDLFSNYVSDKAIIEYFVKSRDAKLIPGEEEDDSDYYYEYEETYRGEKYTHYIDADSKMQGEDGVAQQMTDELGLNEKLRLIDETGEVVLLPISMYEHSGISIWLGSTYGHTDARWDCSSIGFAYVEKATAEKEMPKRKLTDEQKDNWKQWAYDVMEAEMKTYNKYVSGEVYGYMIEDEYGEEGSDTDLCGCWGFYDLGEMLQEAKNDIDNYLDKKAELREKNLNVVVCNISQLAGMTFIYGCTAYHIGKDMFGYDFVEKADIKDSKVGVYVVIDIKTLPDELLNDMAKNIKIVA